MATVNSLICFGGRTGKTVTMTIASPCVVTLTNHGLRAGTGVVFSTTGALPTGITAGTTYYAKSTGANTFNLYDTEANAIAGGATGRVNTSGSQSGTHTIKSAYYLGLSSGQLARYGDSGSERIYDSLSAWVSGRSGASPLDEEVCEIGMAWTDAITAQITNNVPAAATTITSLVDGVRSAAFHGGDPTAGYELYISNSGPYYGIVLSKPYAVVDGFRVTTYSGYFNADLIRSTDFAPTIKNMIVLGPGGTSSVGSYGYGINLPISGATCVNNLVSGCLRGISITAYSSGLLVANNITTKNGIGMYPSSATNITGNFYNNISVGNTTNWGTAAGFTNAAQNAGLSGEAWVSGSYSRVTIATTDFASYPTDMRPAAATSPQVETGSDYYGALLNDITDTTRPAYSGSNYGTAVTAGSFVTGLSYTIVSVGTTDFTLIGASANTVGVTFKATGVGSGTGTATLNAKYDIGPYEFDLGYGAWPSTDYYGLAFTGLVSGSKVKVFTTGTDTELFSTASSSTTETWSVNSSSTVTVDYVVLKAGYEPIRVTGITVTGGPDGILDVPVSQVVARWYQASSGLTINTNCFANASTKKFGLTTASTLQNFASYLLEQWIALGDTTEAYANKPFPIAANGPNSFSWLDGWEADLTTYPNTITNLSRDGMRYLDTSGTATASWAAILSVGVPSGAQVRYQQTDGGTTQSAAVTSGNMDQLVQIYGDATHGNIDFTGYLVLKVQEQGYDQAEADAVSLYGTLEDQLYVVGLAPTANGIAADNPTVNITITDHGASPVTWNSKSFSITITDNATTSGEDILQAIRYAQETGGTFHGTDAFNWHDLMQTNGDKFKGVRGKLYGDTGAALKGVRVLRGADAHPDFTLHTADDGTTVSTTPPAQATASILANSRIQLYNVTTDAELDNSFQTGTSYANTLSAGVSAGDTLRLRVCKLGYEAAEAFAVWTTSGAAFIISQSVDDVYTAWGIDGSTVTEFAPDTTGHIYIESNDADGVSSKTRLGAYFSHLLTTEGGIRYYYGGITFLSTAAIRVNTAVVDLLLENVNATTALRFSDVDVRLYRDDGTSIIAPTSYSIHNDYSGVPDVVETGTSGLTTAESNQLFGLPDADGTAAAIIAAAQTTPIHADIRKVNNYTVTGTGAEGDTWGPA